MDRYGNKHLTRRPYLVYLICGGRPNTTITRGKNVSHPQNRLSTNTTEGIMPEDQVNSELNIIDDEEMIDLSVPDECNTLITRLPNPGVTMVSSEELDTLTFIN